MLARLCKIAAAGVLLSAQEREKALGAHLTGELRKSTTALGDSTVEHYVQHLGPRLAGQAGIRD
jgi:predicted Zn-dependent protease